MRLYRTVYDLWLASSQQQQQQADVQIVHPASLYPHSVSWQPAQLPSRLHRSTKYCESVSDTVLQLQYIIAPPIPAQLVFSLLAVTHCQ